MRDISPLESLGKQVTQNAKVLTEYLHERGYPSPSFDKDAPSIVLPPDSPSEISAARRDLADAALKIFQLATGPSDFIPHLSANNQLLFTLRWLCHFKIFTLVPLDRSMSYVELASAAKVDEKRLKSVVRMAMTSNIFFEPTALQVSHTSVSAMFVKEPNFVDWAIFMADISVPTAANLVEACEMWPGSSQKNETSFNIAFNHDLPLFAYLSQNPNHARQFSNYMKSTTNSEAHSLKHLVSGYDWNTLESTTVVDIGGSTGHASVAVAKAFPNLNFVVQDLPVVVANGPNAIESLPPTVKERISFQAHDFFTEQPLRTASVYLMRMILHDWTDAEAVKLLKALLPAMEESKARLVIMDTVLPDSGKIPAVEERLLRAKDLTMLQVFNSLERSLGDWTTLFKQVDPRLKLCKTVQPAGSSMAILEVQLQPLPEGQLNGYHD